MRVALDGFRSMPMMAYVVFALLAAFCAWGAQRLALNQGRKPLPWMVAAVIFGPFALVPLAILARPLRI